MSTAVQTVIAPAPEQPSGAPRLKRRGPSIWRAMVIATLVCAVAGVVLWYGFRAWRDINQVKEEVIPTAKVVRGDVTLTVTARGELRGGNPEVLTAPLTGGLDMHLTSLKTSGSEVKNGEVVAQFDTTEQEFKLKEAEADLAEAQQHLIQAKAQGEAQDEEDRYALLKAQNDVRLAELDVRKNPLLPALTARENTLALEAAKDHLTQLEHNLANRQATNAAAIAIQEAARGKAESQAKTARQNIDAMTLKAHRDGYVSIRQNTASNVLFFGMVLPMFQVGDLVRPGMAVAEIPDLHNWEIGANIGELDRGHISVGEKTEISIIAVPGHPYKGRVKEMGSTSGPPWNRHFECKIALDNPTAELRPGMSANIVVTTDEMKGVLSLPAQALFESDGRTFVYVRTGAAFTPKDVTLVSRNEMRVVIRGVDEGQLVALANPTEIAKKKAAAGSAMQSLHK
ncbi:MAG TPA: efflux RND transporter periplasmic adaptor subunit [Bryobacteraceae bacterium]|nr:efflux RND transporter periplasmic adaptor subunit [Bryobacteraceae bacterium]